MLQACGDKKRGLTIMVEETSDRIRTKRRQLEDIREELRELGGALSWPLYISCLRQLYTQ